MCQDAPNTPLLAGRRVLVRRVTLPDAGALCTILRTDHVLHRAVGMSGSAPAAPSEFLADTQRWQETHSAICFAIIDQATDVAVGMISLSRIDQEQRSARIGYWLASERWGQGLTSEAFGLVLGLARSLGLRVVRATIASDNTASQRIYLRQGATCRSEVDGKRTYEIQM